MTEDKNKKEDKTKSEGLSPMEFAMFEMMGKCCTEQGAVPDCAGMMKNRMAAMTNTPCSDRRRSKLRHDSKMIYVEN